MRRTEAGAGVALKIFVQEHQIFPVPIHPKDSVAPAHGSPPSPVQQEDSRQPPRELAGYVLKRHVPAGAGGALHLERVSEVLVVTMEGLDDQIVGRKPDWPAPVGVTAE